MEKAYKLEFSHEQLDSLHVNCCGYSQTEGLHSFGPALKPHFLIHYILSGKGRFIIKNREYLLEAGNGFLIEPGELAFYEADEKDPWSYVWVGFEGNQALDYIRKIGLSASHPIFCCDRKKELYRAIKNMMEHNTSGIANNLRRNGELSVFLSLIAAESAVKEADQGDRANAYVGKALEFIQSNYCNPIKVTDIADFVCVNRSYLYTLFAQTIGISPQKFLSSYRLTKAAELLQTTEFSIESIALSCGYHDALVFTRAFKASKGTSPSAYRRRRKTEVKNLTF